MFLFDRISNRAGYNRLNLARFQQLQEKAKLQSLIPVLLLKTGQVKHYAIPVDQNLSANALMYVREGQQSVRVKRGDTGIALVIGKKPILMVLDTEHWIQWSTNEN
tara:strand:- start:360 stop:677 length:318 start_codon:yes stop_codon:yes gene_type:complete